MIGFLIIIIGLLSSAIAFMAVELSYQKSMHKINRDAYEAVSKEYRNELKEQRDRAGKEFIERLREFAK